MRLTGNNGYTLAEIMVAMSIFMVLMVVVYSTANSVQRISSALERKVAAKQDVKPALDIMAMEIGMASYNPTFASNMWRTCKGISSCTDFDNCTDLSSKQEYRGIQEATDNSITIEMDIAGGTAGASDGNLGAENEIIHYEYVDNDHIGRETSCSGGKQPFLGASSDNNRAIRVINGLLNPAIPVFRYFDASGQPMTYGSGATQLPAAIPDIRRIQITLAVETQDVDPNTKRKRRLIYSTSVIPRNHVIPVMQ
ncbi:MAG: hypothetical protein CSYNP_00394 [Syntrophus sp. SKADARSKE-3]|nr:hypothetical protein [Syntrophus sp. SKADARSKE-3]